MALKRQTTPMRSGGMPDNHQSHPYNQMRSKMMDDMIRRSQEDPNESAQHRQMRKTMDTNRRRGISSNGVGVGY